MDNIRVAVWGFGAMGGGIAKVLLEKKGVEITGVCDIHPARVGKSIFELLGVERGERRDVLVCDDINKVAAARGLNGGRLAEVRFASGGTVRMSGADGCCRLSA